MDTENFPLNPIDVVEDVIYQKKWNFSRAADHELVAEIESHWCQYRLYFTWSENISAMSFTITFDLCFPKLKFKKRDLSKVKPDFIYISHTHADHFDPDTLNCFDKSTPILISWYKENFTEKAIKKLGFKDIRVSPKNKPIIQGFPTNIHN